MEIVISNVNSFAHFGCPVVPSEHFVLLVWAQVRVSVSVKLVRELFANSPRLVKYHQREHCVNFAQYYKFYI